MSGTTVQAPKQWPIRRLLDLCFFIPGKAHEPYIDPLGDYICVNSKFISTEGQVAKPCSKNVTPARRGDILMVMSDLPNGRALAKCFLVGEDDKYAVNQRICILRPKAGNDPQLLFHILNRNPYFLLFDDGVNQTHLLNPTFRKCEVAVPNSLPEQRAIAAALSDADGVVAGLERVIAKKRLIKQGAMQVLLTARRRLPGFSGEWDDVSFSEAFIRINLKDKQVQASEYVASGDIPIVDQGKDLIAGYTNQAGKKYSPPEDGVIIFGDHTRIVKHVSFGFAVGADGTQIIGSRKGYHAGFLAVLLSCREIPNTGYNRHFKFLKEMLFRIPTDIGEQAAIASVLSDMDAEIHTLESRLAKARAVKEGMMQNLLTGRVRLV